MIRKDLMMNQFAQNVKVKKSKNVAYGQNGMKAKKSTLNAHVDLYGAMGALRGRYTEFKQLFAKAIQEDMVVAMQLLFMLRDVRTGMGERDLFRNTMVDLEQSNPQVVLKVLDFIPKYGRWDDLLVFQNKKTHKAVVRLIAKGLSDDETKGLVSKWLPRKAKTENARIIMSMLRSYLKLTPKQMRELLVSNCKEGQVVEQKMCANQWDEINYSHVPSRAMTMYRKAFMKHDDEDLFKDYIDSLVNKNEDNQDVKVNAGALFPHNVINSHVVYGLNQELDANSRKAQLVDQTWKALPNFFADNVQMNVLPVVDVSGSMTCGLGGSHRSKENCMDVAIALGLYVSMKNNGAFKNIICPFSQHPSLQKIDDTKLIHEIFDKVKDMDWGMNTNLEATIQEIVRFAQKHNVPSSDMPKYILILSDMNFDAATGFSVKQEDVTAHKMIKQIYTNAGYEDAIPTIIYWNLNHNGTFATKMGSKGSVLLSGFAPTVIADVLSAISDLDSLIEKLTPVNVMKKALERYQEIAKRLTQKKRKKRPYPKAK